MVCRYQITNHWFYDQVLFPDPSTIDYRGQVCFQTHQPTINNAKWSTHAQQRSQIVIYLAGLNSNDDDINEYDDNNSNNHNDINNTNNINNTVSCMFS